MFAPRHDFFCALREARRATRGGDHASAQKWTRLAERHLAIAERFNRLAAPARAPAAQGPVMLDPDGFSPGGTPNWFLNLKRRERAGIT